MDAPAVDRRASVKDTSFRIKEVFAQYDSSGDGFLDPAELGKVLRTLGPSFTQQEIDQWCDELDPSGDGKVSHKEFMEWITKESEGARMVAKAVKVSGDKRAVRIKECFQRYDKGGDGSLNIEEMRDTLRSLGSFNITEIRHACEDLDKNKDGEISFKEFDSWIRAPSKDKGLIKVKAILAPGDADGLESVFYNYCGAGNADMDNSKFVKMCTDANLIDSMLPTTTVDVLFANAKIKAKGGRKVDFEQFEIALEVVAEKKGVKTGVIRTAVLQATPAALQRKTITDGPRKTIEPIKRGRTRKKLSPRVIDVTTVIDNSDLWKVFGGQTKAGLTLRRLYSPPPSTMASSTSRVLVGARQNSNSPRGEPKSFESVVPSLPPLTTPRQLPGGVIRSALKPSPR